MSRIALKSIGSIPNYKLQKNLQLQDSYISNDGGDEGIRIADDGKVGIGNTVPGATLEVSVAGAAAIPDTPTIEISSFSDAQDDHRSSGLLKFQKVANDTINTFGAESHTAAGEVIGRIEAHGVYNASDGSSDAAKISSYIEFAGDAIASPNSVPGKISFATSHSTSSSTPPVRMTIDDGGNVGIGVTDPDSLLEVFGESAQLKLSWNASNYAAITVADDGHLELATTGTDGDITLDSASGIMLETSALYVYPTGASSQSFYFDMSGNPKLTINSTANAGDEFSIEVGAEGVTRITTVDADTAVAHLTIAPDGDFNVDTIGAISLDNSSGGDILLNSGRHITLRTASSGNIYFDSVMGMFHFRDASDGDDAFKITVAGGTGATSLETISDGADGHLSIVADGKIILNSPSGGFEMHGGGSTVKFADMYAGMILGYRMIGEDASNTTYTFTTDLTVPDSDMTVRFIAPPSGAIEVTVQFTIDGSAGRYNYIGLSDNATFNSIGDSYTQSFNVTDETDFNTIQHSWVVTELTAGDTYNYWMGVSSSSTLGFIRWGGTAPGRYADFIMKVIALPAAVSDFAVYD